MAEAETTEVDDHENPLSALGYPFWLNPTTIKGSIAIAAGLFVLAAPGASAVVLRFVLGGAVILSGLSVGWFSNKTLADRARWLGLLEALAAVAVGIFLIVFPLRTITLIVRVAAVYLGIRSVTAFLSAYRRSPGTNRSVDLVRGFLALVLGVVMFLLPVGIASGLIFAAAAAAVLGGGIMLGYGIAHSGEAGVEDLDTASFVRIAEQWLFSQDLGDERRDEIGDGLYFEPPGRASKLVAWWTMLLLSVAIATFAILQDSTAVVIGAMLIAPLMTPIVGAAGAIVNGWARRMAASFALIAAGVAAAIGLAYIIGAWAPALVPLTANSQVTSRVSPNLLDMAIAIFAGAAGAFAIVNKRVADSIAGVAIAVALVPPLGVVGLTFQAGMYGEAWGAFLLFATNLVSIIIAATVVFFLTGFAPIRRWQEHRERINATLGTVVAASLIILIPLTFTAQGVLSSAATQSSATKAVDDWLGDSPDLRVVEVRSSPPNVEVVITGQGDVPPVSELDALLDKRLARNVTVTVEYVPSIIYRSQS